MIAQPVLVDAGPLVAMLRRNDAHHLACIEQAKELAQPMLTCWPVLTEAAWLLSDVRRVVDLLRTGKLRCLELDEGAAERIGNHAQTYSSLRPQLADLCLLYLAERHGIDLIFTLDRRDFTVYRTSQGKSLQLLPASL